MLYNMAVEYKRKCPYCGGKMMVMRYDVITVIYCDSNDCGFQEIKMDTKWFQGKKEVNV